MNNKQSDSMGFAFWGIPGPARARDDSKPVKQKGGSSSLIKLFV